MAIESLKRIVQIPTVRKEKDVDFPPYSQKRPKQQKDKKKGRGGIDIKV